MRIRLLLVATGLIALLPLAAKAECISGPNVVINSAHGASIQFPEPVYQAKIFDPSQVVLSEIPDSGAEILMLTRIDRLDFPGLPSGNGTTTLLAETADACYTFSLSFGDGNFHASVNAEGNRASEPSLLAARRNDLEPIDIELLKIALDNAVARVGSENSFLQRTEQFITLVDEEGVGQTVAAQRLSLDWNHLTQLANSARFSNFSEGSVAL